MQQDRNQRQRRAKGADLEGRQGGGNEDDCRRARRQRTLHGRGQGGRAGPDLAGPGPYTVFVPDDAAFSGAPAGTFDIKPENRGELTGVLTNLILPGTVMVADIDKAIDSGKGKAVLATMSGTLTATKDGGKTMLTDGSGHKATITQGDELYTNGVVHHVDAVLMPSKRASGPAVGQKAGK